MAMAGRMLCFLILSDAESGSYRFGPRISTDNGTLSDITMMEAYVKPTRFETYAEFQRLNNTRPRVGQDHAVVSPVEQSCANALL
jgi:hypothetical protein